MLNNQIKSLLDKEMDRREFLLTIFKGMLVFIGFSAVLKGMLHATGEKTNSANLFASKPVEIKQGFGSSRFGI